MTEKAVRKSGNGKQQLALLAAFVCMHVGCGTRSSKVVDVIVIIAVFSYQSGKCQWRSTSIVVWDVAGSSHERWSNRLTSITA